MFHCCAGVSHHTPISAVGNIILLDVSVLSSGFLVLDAVLRAVM
jgi:hypothetical protein